jgi:mediator of RNA polymerase II transcription subunit 5
MNDPLFYPYITLFLKEKAIASADLLLALLDSSLSRSGGSGNLISTRTFGQPCYEERVFTILTQIHLSTELPASAIEVHSLVHALIKWVHHVCEYETGRQLEGAGLDSVHPCSLGAYEALGSLAISILGNPGIRNVAKQSWWKDGRARIVEEMQNYDANILQWMQSQVAGRLRALTGMPPYIKTDSKGRPVLTDEQILDAIPQVPTLNSRAGLFLWLNAALAARPLTDDLSVLGYLHARYPGNVQSLIVDLLVAAFDNLTNAMLRKEIRQNFKVIRSFICNKLPTLIAMLSGSIGEQITPEACIQMALIPGGLISMTPLPPISAGATDIEESLKGTRLEFLQACALHGLVAESTIAAILRENIALPRVAKYSKDALVAQCANNISRLAPLIDDLNGMQGNAGAVSACIVETINNLCMSKDTMSLKTVCNELTKRIAYMDIIMQYTLPNMILLPLCNLLNDWVHDQDQTEFTPSYEEFASILLLTLATMHRYDIQWPDVGILGDSFVARLIDEMSCSKPPSELPDEQGSQLAKWIEGLFAVDDSGETSGIGDDVMRQCSPQNFYLLVPTLFEQSVLACRSNALAINTFKGGLELLLEPFLLPSLIMGLGWLVEHSWEDHNDVEVLLQVLEKLLKPSSSSQETQAMHKAILSMVATPWHDSLQELQRRQPDKKKVAELSALLKPYLNSQRTLNCRRDELDQWIQDEGALKSRVQQSIRDLIRWASTSTNPPDPPPRYAHKLFAIACQALSPEILLSIIIAEIIATDYATIPTALDVCISMICAPTSLSASALQPGSTGSMSPVAALRNHVRHLVSAPQTLLSWPQRNAEALVQLSRRIEAQMSIAQMPPLALPLQMHDQTADQMMQDLGLDIPAAADGNATASGAGSIDLGPEFAGLGDISSTTAQELVDLANAGGASGGGAGGMDLDDFNGLLDLKSGGQGDQDGSQGMNNDDDIFAGLDIDDFEMD